MISELEKHAPVGERKQAMRGNGWLSRFFAALGLLGAAALCAGAIACGDEQLTCCECKYACTPTDPSGVAMFSGTTALTVCDCPDGGYTYGECGVFCKDTLRAALPQIQAQSYCACGSPGCGTTCYAPVPGQLGYPTVVTFTCGSDPTMPPEPSSTLAKNSCSPGVPVGE